MSYFQIYNISMEYGFAHESISYMKYLVTIFVYRAVKQNSTFVVQTFIQWLAGSIY